MLNKPKMTPRERVARAMALEQPDRVPLMCQFSIGSMMHQLKPSPAEFWYDGALFAMGISELCQRFSFDGILVSLHGHDPNWRDNVLSVKKIEEGKQELTFDDRTEIHCWNDLPLVKFNNLTKRKSITDKNILLDVPDSIDYIPVSQNLYFKIDSKHKFDIFDYLYETTKGEYSIHGEITSPFDYFLDLLGYEEGLISLIMHPELSKEILGKFTQGVKALVSEMCLKNIDAVKISSPFAGMGFISPQHYAEYVLPYEREIINAIKSRGKAAYIHTCGHIGDRLELMMDSGASGLECLDPPPVGNVDLGDAIKRVGDRMFIKGNIDSIHTLLYADDKRAEEDVRKIIDTGMHGKGFILSTACSIAPKVSASRLEMLNRLVLKYGIYQ